MKKMWKKFWTLTKRQSGGFTLVELIVVIAILAILAGVGVPVYSGYVKKANMQADMMLVSEIEKALILAGYNSDADHTGYVVLTNADEGEASNESLEAALETAFGVDWETTLQLKYDGWTDAATMLNNVTYAQSVNGSSYINNVGTEKLMGDVQACVGAVSGFLSSITGGDYVEGKELLYAALQNNDAFNSALSEYDEDELNEAVLSNALVFAVANNASASKDTVIGQFSNPEYLLTGPSDAFDNDGLAGLANWYAAAEAYAAQADAKTQAKFAEIDMQAQKDGKVDSEAILASMGEFSAYLNDKIVDGTTEDAYSAYAVEYFSYFGIDYAGKGPNDDYGTLDHNQAKLDGEAYVSIMSTVDNLNTEYTGDKSAMSDKSLFVSGTMMDRVDSYVAAANLAGMLSDSDLAALKGKINGKAAVVVVVLDSGAQVVCVPCPAEAGA